MHDGSISLELARRESHVTAESVAECHQQENVQAQDRSSNACHSHLDSQAFDSK
jgi:hypothetical protein